MKDMQREKQMRVQSKRYEFGTVL